VNGRSFIDRANVQQVVATQLKALDWIEKKRLDNPQYTSRFGPGLVNEVWRDVEDARARYISLAAEPDRPAITGIANIAFQVSNLEAARNFYGHVLGYEEFSVSPGREEGPPAVTYYKVNDRQYIEISPGLKSASDDKLLHIGFVTDDARQLREYLAGKGVDVPAKVEKDVCGNLSFLVKDPERHAVEFVQYLPDSIQSRNSGNYIPTSRLSDHILHVGINVKDDAKVNRFYKDILGFRLLWEGGPVQNPKAWISYLVPNGTEWVEYMMAPNPSPAQLGSMHHVALEVTDIQKPYEVAITRGYTAPARPVVARDGRWLNNFFDPDGSRTEYMIRTPVEKPCCTDLHDPYLTRVGDTPPPVFGGPVQNLRVENGASPRGVKALHPQLSWNFAPQQRAYQILVATSEQKLRNDEADLWDSGRVQSDKKSAEYQGKGLTSYQKCYWKVRTWGDYDSTLGYTEPAAWQMGLLGDQ
jgi:lactoylglutathione lyase